MFYDAVKGEANAIRSTPYGRVGEVYSGHGIEMAWISKQGEEIDPEWVCQDEVDLLVVIQGELKVEFESRSYRARVMKPGEILVLPPGTKCRAYRWPREADTATVFIAAYPTPSEHDHVLGRRA